MLKLIFLQFAAVTAYAQCGQLEGIVTGPGNARITGAELSVKVNGRKIRVGKTDASGSYAVKLPCETGSIQVEAKDYQPLLMPVYADKVEGAVFFVPFLLYPLDKQVHDMPYSQSQQKHYELKQTDTKTLAIVRSLKVQDAFTGVSLPAEVCLFYTQNQKRECFQLDTAAAIKEIEFKEKDIVAMEVKAPGYQGYQGNLILDQPGGEARTYTIKLLKQPVIFSVSISSDLPIEKCFLTSSNSQVELSKAAGNQFYSRLPAAGSYTVRMFAGEESPVFSAAVNNLKPGLNLKIYNIPKGAKPVETVPVSLPGNKKTLYFAQSDYKLSAAAQDFLDSLVASLKSNSERLVRIVGHTDNVGKPLLNVMLSEFRAKVTANYLISKGVARAKVYWTGVGGKYPQSPNDTEENKSKNRRVEILLVEL